MNQWEAASVILMLAEREARSAAKRNGAQHLKRAVKRIRLARHDIGTGCTDLASWDILCAIIAIQDGPITNRLTSVITRLDDARNMLH